MRRVRIQAIGIVTETAQTAPKPDFGGAGLNWSEEGWFAPVYYSTLKSPIRPKDYIGLLEPVLPIVPDVRNGLLDAWGIDAETRIGTFNSQQREFSEYQRTNIFQRDR